MAITYPLTLPTHTGIRSVSFRAKNAVAYSMSPFTFAGQAHQYPGQMWEADITLPTMRRSNAEQWNAFLMSLNGQAGTFLLGDPNGCVPRGNYSQYTTSEVGGLLLESGDKLLLEDADALLWERGAVGNIAVNGDGQVGASLNVKDCIANVSSFFKAGDYIQLGSAASSTLHKILVDVDTDSLGYATLEIWPSVRNAPSDNAIVTVTNCKGVFRLAENTTGWNADVAQYGITFTARQAL